MRTLAKTSLILSLALFPNCQSSRNVAPNPIPAPTPISHGAKLLATQLGSADPLLRDRAANSIVKLAAESDEFRRMIVAELVANVEAENVRVIVCETGCPEKYEKWKRSVEILGEIKATEAIPALVKRIDFNNGPEALSLSYFPCGMALVKIGPASVQPLLETFTGDDSDRPQILAVWALHSIGDPTARAALVKILKFERNRLRRDEIKLILKDWKVKNTPD